MVIVRIKHGKNYANAVPFYSSNYGASFANVNSTGFTLTFDEGSYISGDGLAMVNSGGPTDVWISNHDGGTTTFTKILASLGNSLNLGPGGKNSIAMSNDGSRLYVAYDKYIYVSTDKLQTITLHSTSATTVTTAAPMPTTTTACVGSIDCKYILTWTTAKLFLTVDPNISE